MDTMKLREALEDLERRMDSIGHNVELRNTGVAPYLVDKWALELAALAKSLAAPPVTNAAPPSDEQIKYMVNRFLAWRLPENFNPDGGVSFKKVRNEHTTFPAKNEPVGTNLLDATQAEEMVRYLVEHLPAAAPAPSEETREKWAFNVVAALARQGYWRGTSEDHHDSERIVNQVLQNMEQESKLATQPPAAREGGGEMVTASEALKKWADGPFACPTDPSHKLSYRGYHCEECGTFIGYHCEECGTFIGAPKSREELLTALITEREMHNAWRKRAEEAEVAEVAEVALKAATPPHCPKCDTPLPDFEYRAEGQPARTWVGEKPLALRNRRRQWGMERWRELRF